MYLVFTFLVRFHDMVEICFLSPFFPEEVTLQSTTFKFLFCHTYVTKFGKSVTCIIFLFGGQLISMEYKHWVIYFTMYCDNGCLSMFKELQFIYHSKSVKVNQTRLESGSKTKGHLFSFKVPAANIWFLLFYQLCCLYIVDQSSKFYQYTSEWHLNHPHSKYLLVF